MVSTAGAVRVLSTPAVALSVGCVWLAACTTWFVLRLTGGCAQPTAQHSPSAHSASSWRSAIEQRRAASWRCHAWCPCPILCIWAPFASPFLFFLPRRRTASLPPVAPTQARISATLETQFQNSKLRSGTWRKQMY